MNLRIAPALMLLSFVAHLYAAAPATASRTLLATLSPAPGATNVCIDTPLSFTFSAPPTVAKTGTVQLLDDAGAVVDSIDLSARTRSKTIGGLPNFNDYPVVITGNDAAIIFKNSVLSYGKSYTVKLPDGLFLDKDGRPINFGGAANWRFTTKAAAPMLAEDGSRRLTVAAEGNGDFATVQGALDFIPGGNTVPTTIDVQRGIYREIVYVANKHNLTILGVDRKATIIACADNQNLNNTDTNRMPGGYRRGMLRAVNCNDLVIANLTLHNTTPQGGSQAEAIILDGGPRAHAILANVDLYSYQDTLQINGQAFVSNCYIEGDVDFMWGAGPVYFQHCVCRALRRNAYYTQIRNTAANHGYVYDQCRFEGAPGATGNFLSRIDPGRFPSSEVVLLDCTLTDAVGDVAWRFDNAGNAANAAGAPHVRFWEYNSRDGAGNAVDVSRRLAGSRQLSRETDAEAITNYSNPAWVLGDNWTPRVPVGLLPPAK